MPLETLQHWEKARERCQHGVRILALTPPQTHITPVPNWSQ